jgi:hypothetical protein
MKVKAKIYRPAKTAMQSGRAKTHSWIYEYKPLVKKSPEPLMGWNSGGTLEQIYLKFDSKEAAVAYAKERGVPYEVMDPTERKVEAKSYAANFAYDRRTAFSPQKASS